ncbi:hypothetical protein PTTG_12618 [Puccinia triticina 1-1 BBBD Race 1]|uniref:Uncharacterized protein n=2 Tax=Puccinia triticina TaxID=208348 RepID=A0A180GS27_PUCT1|nr:hypothetical protein PTTG_12618 [Puccinia triticina 1-1 BBBD Race 1]
MGSFGGPSFPLYNDATSLIKKKSPANRVEAFWSQVNGRLQDDPAPAQPVERAPIWEEDINSYLNTVRQFRKPRTGCVDDYLEEKGSKKEAQMQIKFMLEDFYFMTKDLDSFIKENENEPAKQFLIPFAQEMKSVHKLLLQPSIENVLGKWAYYYDLPQPKIFEEGIYAPEEYIQEIFSKKVLNFMIFVS